MTNSDSKKNVPNHVAIIMDGNRRWARERNLPTMEGHLRGYEKFKQAPNWFFSRGISIVSVYAFSTENWKRSQEEVNYLMKLLDKAIENELSGLEANAYRIMISGRTDELPGNLGEKMLDLADKTKQKKGGILNICFNYGGRAELIDAFKKMLRQNITEEQVHEGMIRKYLYSGELPDPDIIVRTSGEQRLSGFLLWQSAYSELMFMNKYWPDIEERDIDLIINEYNKRERRYGGNGTK